MTGPDGGDGGRPRDLGAERAVLGAMMLNPAAVADVTVVLTVADFSLVAHAVVFSTIVGLWERDQPTDPVAVAGALAAPELLRVGGAPYLHTLIAEVPTAANAGYYADLVADRAVRARLLAAGTRICQDAVYGGKEETSEVVERAQETLAAVTVGETVDSDAAWLSELVDEQLENWNVPHEAGVAAPFIDLNDLLAGGRGLLPGQFAVVAGRPGTGKSTLLTDWCLSAAHAGVGVLLASLEMGRHEIVDKLIAAEATVRLSDLKARRLNEVDDRKAREVARQIGRLPIRIIDRHSMTVAQLRAAAKQMSRSPAGLGLVALDYIQLLSSPGKVESREKEVSAFTRGLKSLAKELWVPVLAPSQLNRAVESRTDKTPQLSDLRETGSIEQDADLVILVHRPDYYDRESTRAGETDLILAKQRNGPTSSVTVAHQLHYSRFADLSRRTPEMGAAA